MTSTQGLVAAYFAVGIIAVAALFVWARKEGVRPPSWLSIIGAPEALILLLLVAVAIWPLYLLGVLICWLDGKSAGDTARRESDKAPRL